MSVADDFDVLTSVSWEDRSWWNGALRRETAIDYFSCSQFYDRSCLNEQLKMQRDLTPEAAQARLRQLPGILYRLDEARTQEVPPTANEEARTLYVIQKLHRDHRGLEKTLRYYYVLNGVVHEAPTLAAVLKSRLLKLGFYLHEAFLATNPAASAAASASHRRAAESEEGGRDDGAHDGAARREAREEPPGASRSAKRARTEM